MRKSVLITIIATIIGAVGITATVVDIAKHPLPRKNYSSQALSFFDATTGSYVSSKQILDWDSTLIGSTSPKDSKHAFFCPVKSDSAAVFLSTQVNEGTISSSWIGYEPLSIDPITSTLVQPKISMASILKNNPKADAIRKAGGKFSIGIACTHRSFTRADMLSYRFINIQPGTGKWRARHEARTPASAKELLRQRVLQGLLIPGH